MLYSWWFLFDGLLFSFTHDNGVSLWWPSIPLQCTITKIWLLLSCSTQRARRPYQHRRRTYSNFFNCAFTTSIVIAKSPWFLWRICFDRHLRTTGTSSSRISFVRVQYHGILDLLVRSTRSISRMKLNASCYVKNVMIRTTKIVNGVAIVIVIDHS